MASLTEPAKLLLLVTLLAKDKIISNNGKSYIKELILRRDPRLGSLIQKFELKDSVDMSFLEEIHDLIGSESQALYDELFRETGLEVGKTLSKREREEKSLNDEKSLIYGEVEFDSFYRILRKINPPSGGVFYDLGSGTGKALFVARLTRDFDKCIGIEILESLHGEASRIVQKYNDQVRESLALGQSQYCAVFEGSFLDYDWSDGTLVFANSTCFSDELMQQLSEQAAKLSPGAMVVTFTKGMTSPHFEVLERKRYRMSWGPATVFIHRRLSASGQPVGPAKLNILPSDSAAYYDGDIGSPQYQPQPTRAPPQYENDDIDGDDDEEDEGEEENENEGDDEGDDESEEEDEDDEDDDDEDLLADLNISKSSFSQQQRPITQQRSPQHVSNSTQSTPQRKSHSESPRAKFSPVYPEERAIQSNSNSAVKKSPSLQQASKASAASDFAMLNSPQDTALLLRKRSASKNTPPSTIQHPPQPPSESDDN